MLQKHRWPRLIAAVINGFLLGILLTWSYFRDDLGTLFPSWSASNLSLVFSIHNVSVCIALFLTGLLLKRLSHRTMLFIAATMLLAGFGSFPFLPADHPELALVLASVFFGVIAACSIGIGVSAGYSLYTQWMPDQPGKLIGIMSLACSVAPIIAGAVCSRLIPIVGVLHAVRWVGIVVAALIYATLPLAKPPGPDFKMPSVPSRMNNTNQADCSPREMLLMPSFWLLLAFNAVIRTSGLIIIDFGGSIAIHFGAAALVGLLFSPATGVANIVGGVLVDKLSTPRVMYLCSGLILVSAILLLSGNAAGSAFLATAGLIAGGFSYGCCTVHCSASVRVLFGPKHYAQNLGYVQMSILLAAGGGYLAGRLLDSRGGNYQGVFILILVFALVSVACGAGMRISLMRNS